MRHARVLVSREREAARFLLRAQSRQRNDRLAFCQHPHLQRRTTCVQAQSASAPLVHQEHHRRDPRELDFQSTSSVPDIHMQIATCTRPQFRCGRCAPCQILGAQCCVSGRRGTWLCGEAGCWSFTFLQCCYLRLYSRGRDCGGRGNQFRIASSTQKAH